MEIERVASVKSPIQSVTEIRFDLEILGIMLNLLASTLNQWSKLPRTAAITFEIRKL